jgi:flavin-dependent dehydrogenase
LRFIHQHPGLQDSKIIDVRAYPVPVGGHAYNLHKNHTLLIGDAANLADPWLGEGLYYAFASAELASEVIIAHAQNKLEDLSGYTQGVNKKIISQFQYAKKLSILVNLLPFISTSILKSSQSAQAKVIDLLRGDRSYQQIYQDIKRKIPARFCKIFQVN